MKNKIEETILLIYSTDRKLFAGIEASLHKSNVSVLRAESVQETLSLFERHSADIIFIDIENMQLQEMDIVNYIKTRSPATEIIILATINNLENATYSLRYGASFYLIKPISRDDLKRVIGKVCTKIKRNREHIEFEQQVLSDLMSGNPAMQKIFKLSQKIAPTSSTVLIGGESGTGKEFFAKIIHRMSQRFEGKFVAMNCGAVPDTLFESELFGYKKGAFTGAYEDKRGLVEEADMGTLFLDEVGELSQHAQVKLLRFLQERSYRRVGDPSVRTVNVRILAATNKDLTDMIKKGTFREDLYYRLNVFYLYLPPLRERKETIPNLIHLFVQRNKSLLNKNITSISKAAEVVLAGYNYPGNVRELENIIEHAMILAEGPEITEKDLPEFMFGNRLLLSAPGTETAFRLGIEEPSEIDTLEEVEKKYIRKALQKFNYNYTLTSEKLGISRSTLWRKMKLYNIDKE